MIGILFNFLLIANLFLFLIQPVFALRTMDYSKQALIEADFSSQDLHGVTFNLANLLKANLSECNLEGASLFRAKLQEANLSNSNLSGATLDSAVLEDTNLDNTILENAFAFDTRFTNVSIKGADFTNVLIDQNALEELCKIADGVNPVTRRSTRDTLDCS
tara:strand:+ start:182 stop:664 length:483 start_codon:yes stop_codon:yes gene_type:complete